MKCILNIRTQCSPEVVIEHVDRFDYCTTDASCIICVDEIKDDVKSVLRIVLRIGSALVLLITKGV